MENALQYCKQPKSDRPASDARAVVSGKIYYLDYKDPTVIKVGDKEFVIPFTDKWIIKSK
jgi:hypothetical protein